MLTLKTTEGICFSPLPLPEGEGHMSWADSTAGGRGPRVEGGLHCRRERATCRGRTPLPEGEGRVSRADSTAGGRGPSVVGGLHCRREKADCRRSVLLSGGEPSVVGIYGLMDKQARGRAFSKGGGDVTGLEF